MGKFFRRIAQALGDAGFLQAAKKLSTHGAGFLGARRGEAGQQQVVLGGKSFDLTATAGLAVDDATKHGVSTRVTNPRNVAEKARVRELISEVAAAR